MGLLKKGKKKELKIVSRGGASGLSSERPQYVEKKAPCIAECPSGNDVRRWTTLIAQREKLGWTEDEALTKAWQKYVETNPFPSTMGRVCPHPCETACNRKDKDGAVAINAVERYIGDYGLEKGLKLTKLTDATLADSIGVIGGGPAGLSFAYQLVRHGYQVTVYEATDKAGGMLYWGIPFYRLPADVLQQEIDRIVDLGVELKLNCKVGKDISVDELKAKHKAIFLGIGAFKGKLMRIPGEEGSSVYTGTDYLFKVHAGDDIDVGKSVVVVGGGDTAIDAARMARRAGADVTILYRRTRVEMPAIDSEVEDALKEDIKIEFLVAPNEVKRDGDGKMQEIVIQRMELGEPDSSGRRRPVPIEGDTYTIAVDTMIAAVSQQPDFDPIPAMGPTGRWLEADEHMKVKDKDIVWTGGDALDLGIATTAVGQGRKAAEAVHSQLGGEHEPYKDERPPVPKERLKLDWYEAKERNERTHRPVAEWVSKPNDEITMGLSKEQLLAEAGRCFSCGSCFACENCWMYCTPSCFKKLSEQTPGSYFSLNIDTCDGCKKCADECPCGYIDMI